MFSKISVNNLRKKNSFSILFQFFIAPLIVGTICAVIWFLLGVLYWDFDTAVFNFFIKEPIYILPYLLSFLAVLTNILSVIPFMNLTRDSIQKQKETKIILCQKILPCYEIHGIRKTKNFIINTFSKRETAEYFLYDENNAKYRLLWSERFGNIKEYRKLGIAKKIEISYFKRSKIIFNCEILEE